MEIIDTQKIKAIKNWPRPSTSIHSFLGMAEYNRIFVENFTSITAPLTKLTQKTVKFQWIGICEQSLLITALVLAPPEGPDGYIIYCGASGARIGCVLMQHGQVTTYVPRQFKSHERNYPTYNLELAAVIYVLKV